MPFTPKDWADSPATTTPITAAELERIEGALQTTTALAEAAIPATIVNAKGDFIVATGADVVARVAVGANNTVPVADSGQTPGIRWALVQGAYVTGNAQTGTSYTPVLADQGKLVTLTNAAAITVTLPQNSDLAFPIWGSFDVAVLGAGMVTFTQGTGATVTGTPSLVTRATGSGVTVVKISTNGWWVVGDLAG